MEREVFLANTFAPNMLGRGSTARIREITEKEALRHLKGVFTSVISHELTAKFLSRRWGFFIPFKKESLSLVKRSRIIVAAPQFWVFMAQKFSQEEIENSEWRFFSVLIN